MWVCKGSREESGCAIISENENKAGGGVGGDLGVHDTKRANIFGLYPSKQI